MTHNGPSNLIGTMIAAVLVGSGCAHQTGSNDRWARYMNPRFGEALVFDVATGAIWTGDLQAGLEMEESRPLPSVSRGEDCSNASFRCYRSGDVIYAWPNVPTPPNTWVFEGAEFEIVCHDRANNRYCVRRLDGPERSNPSIFVMEPEVGITSFILPYAEGRHEAFMLTSRSALLGPEPR